MNKALYNNENQEKEEDEDEDEGFIFMYVWILGILFHTSLSRQAQVVDLTANILYLSLP